MAAGRVYETAPAPSFAKNGDHMDQKTRRLLEEARFHILALVNVQIEYGEDPEFYEHELGCVERITAALEPPAPIKPTDPPYMDI